MSSSDKTINQGGQQTISGVIAWLIVVLVPYSVFFLSGPHLTSDQRWFVAIAATAVAMWVFRLVPDFVPGLAVILLATLLELVPQDVAFSGFYSQIFFLVMGVFILAAMLSETHWLDRLNAALAQGGVSSFKQILTLLASALLLTLMVPSPLGRATMLKPLLDKFASSQSATGTSIYALLHVHGTTLMSTVFLTGNPLNFILLAMLSEQTRGRFQWLGWLQASMVVALVLSIGLIGFALWAQRFVSPPQAEPKLERDALAARTPGTVITRKDWGVLGLYGLLLISVFTQSLHQIPLAWVVVFLALVVFLFQGLSLQSLRSKVDWPTLIFIATVVAWGGMLDHLALSQWLVAQIELIKPIFEANFALGIGLIIGFVLLVRLVVPGAPAFILLAATLLPFAASVGVSPWLVGFIVVTVSESFLFPYQHGVYSQTISELDAQQVAYRPGLMLLVNVGFLSLRIVAIYASLPWWQSLYFI